MSKFPQLKVLLVDVDGVLVVPPRLFSHIYAEENSMGAAQIEPFFHGVFREATIGKADLKELIAENRDVWNWSGDPAALLERWFEAENHIDQTLLAILVKLRQIGILVYLATDQEKYRADYLRRVMFPDDFDGMFVSCELGITKASPKYFEVVLAKLQQQYPDLMAEDVMFIDDREANIESARIAGLRAEVYAGHDQIERLIE